MRVRMTRLSAGPDGVLQPGRVVDLPEARALALIAADAAVVVPMHDVERRETATVQTPEARVDLGPGLEMVPGVGEARADDLAWMGIGTAADLAAADAEAIAEAIVGVGVATARRMIEAARDLVGEA